MTPRPALAGEASTLARLHALAFDAPWSADEITGFLTAPGGYALTVDGNSGMAGFILCRAVAGEAEILTLAVDPVHRRAGIGRALVEAAASPLTVETMFLEVARDNAAALALYATAGFRQVGTRPRYYAREASPPVDALVLRRDLNR
jgi:ribosomal-protein-alanine N-acetyltransferase